MDYQEHDKEKAIREIWLALRNPLMLMSVPDREVLFALARFHNVTAEELLDLACDRIRNA